jgi:hypothetical protein
MGFSYPSRTGGDGLRRVPQAAVRQPVAPLGSDQATIGRLTAGLRPSSPRFGDILPNFYCFFEMSCMVGSGRQRLPLYREIFVTRGTEANGEPGGLTARGVLAGEARATSTATGVLTARGALAGEARATSTVTGVLTVQGADGVLEAAGIVGSSVVAALWSKCHLTDRADA